MGAVARVDTRASSQHCDSDLTTHSIGAICTTPTNSEIFSHQPLLVYVAAVSDVHLIDRINLAFQAPVEAQSGHVLEGRR